MTAMTISYGTAPPARSRILTILQSRAVLALMDQGVASLGNFATIILVLRALSVESFGRYSLLMEVFLFLNSLQAALIIYPLLVKGAAMEMEGLRRLSGACSILSVGLGVVLAVGLVITSRITHAELSVWLLAPVAMLLAQIQELLRRTLIAHLRFAAAIPGDAISYMLQAAILFVLYWHHAITVPIVFIVMGGTSALAALVQAMQIGIRFDIGWKDLKTLAVQCFTAGKWIAAANLTTLVAFQGYSFTLMFYHGLPEVGRATVITNTLRFANPIVQALSGAIVPAVSRAAAHGSLAQARRSALKFSALAALFLVPFMGVLLIFPQHSLAILCKKDQTGYLTLGPLLRVYTIGFAVMAINQFTLAYLNGLGYSRVNFFSMATNAVGSLLIGLPLVRLWGISGTMWGGGFCNLLMLAVTLYMAFHYQHEPAPGPSEQVPQTAVEVETVTPDMPGTPA